MGSITADGCVNRCKLRIKGRFYKPYYFPTFARNAMTRETTITGTVTPGNRLGRRLGFPTANIPLPDGCPVRDGVWIAVAQVDAERFPAVADLGHKPSVGGTSVRSLEVHLLGYEGDLYGRTVSVVLKKFIRPERKFPSIEALRESIARDCRTAEAYFKDNGI